MLGSLGVEMLGAETGACVEVEEVEWIVLCLVFWFLSTDSEDIDVEFSDCNITDVGDPSVGEQASVVEEEATCGSVDAGTGDAILLSLD